MEATERRSGENGDTDLALYSLRKYLTLAVKENPTVLLPLPGVFPSRQAGRFLGSTTAQHQRMLGGRRRHRVPNRPELIARYGWSPARRSRQRSPRSRRR